MKQKFFLFLGLCTQLLGITAFAQKSNAVKPVKPAEEKSLLWKVSGKDLKGASYIFGTIHAICSEDYFFTEKMTKAFNECNQLILEVNLADQNLGVEFQHNMLLPDGLTLHDFFSDENEYQLFAQRLREKAEIELETFNSFKPFVLISALALKGFTCDRTASYEMNLIALSKDKKMLINALETVNRQIAFFDEIPREEIKEMMLSSLKSDKEMAVGDANEAALMVDLYKQQDIAGLSKMINDSPEVKNHQNELIYDRNRDWVSKLPEMMKKNKSFIAVGAGHLSGDQGVLHLLKEAGYKVEAVK
ncbi:MAG: TraB/GumN family protein [Bacteroidetes bacterium]|nr:TraB/GumN family protein [Bacteroidota bacterium]